MSPPPSRGTLERTAHAHRWHPPAAWVLLALVGALYGLSALTLVAVQIPVVVPWRFLLHVLGIALPYGYCLARIVALPGRVLGVRRVLVVGGGLALGLLVLWHGPQVGTARLLVLVVFCGFVARDLRRLPETFFRHLTATLATLVLCLGTVWNLNYLLVPHLPGPLRDPAVMRLDLALYRWLLGPDTEYRGLFPLLQSPALFRIMENAYHTLFVEMLVVLLVLLWARRDPTPFLRGALLCYLAALVVFYVYPVVGPCIFYPETFRTEFAPTATARLMRELAAEFHAAAARAPAHGFAYFVAVPSLHAALALLCQGFLRVSPLHFWTFLPVNVAIALSTITLGYHYIVDVPLGLSLAALALVIVGRTPARAARQTAGNVWAPAH